jgi:hypothetical protein
MLARVCAAIAALTMTFALSNSAVGQEVLIGKWSGTYEVEGARRTGVVGIELTVEKMDGGNVAGTWALTRGPCRDTYPFTGTFKGNRLRINAPAGSKQGCGPYTLGFTLEGSKLVGRFAKQDVALTQ